MHALMHAWALALCANCQQPTIQLHPSWLDGDDVVERLCSYFTPDRTVYLLIIIRVYPHMRTK